MRILYLDCGMGAAGDMLSAALYELLDNKEDFLREINGLNIPRVTISAKEEVKCGIKGTHMEVTVGGVQEGDYCNENMHHYEHKHNCEHHHQHNHEDIHDHNNNHDHDHDHDHHHHSSMDEIKSIISKFSISDKVKHNILSVYKLIAEAESSVHGVSVTDIHFHEVGTMDAIADITAVCMLMDKLKIDKVFCSPIHVGSGQVHCAHGILPVPAPATAYILRDIPIYSGTIKGELCTPTGAALLHYFVDSFGEMPVMTVKKIGYGMGKKDFEAANCVRVMVGETKDKAEEVLELCCNIDDMTGEKIGFAMECLFEAGALEVYTVPIGMKKSRPGILLSVMCKESHREKILKIIFTHTSTIGVRENISRRYTLTRTISTVNTSMGEVRVKRSQGYGVTREKYEYEDLARIAREKGISIEEVINRID